MKQVFGNVLGAGIGSAAGGVLGSVLGRKKPADKFKVDKSPPYAKSVLGAAGSLI